MISDGTPIVALLIRHPPESKSFVQIGTDPLSTDLNHHFRRDEVVERGELDMVINPVKRKDQMQFFLIAIIKRSFLSRADFSTIVVLRQRVGVEVSVVEYATWYQQVRIRYIPRISALGIFRTKNDIFDQGDYDKFVCCRYFYQAKPIC